MLKKTTQEFLSDAEQLLLGAARNDDFVKIETSAGNAVLVSEAEWNIMLDAFKAVIAAATK